MSVTNGDSGMKNYLRARGRNHERNQDSKGNPSSSGRHWIAVTAESKVINIRPSAYLTAPYCTALVKMINHVSVAAHSAL